MKTINIAEAFSPYPAGRRLDDGPYSGEAFRERHLKPALESGEAVSVELDGSAGFGSSFLEEAFGGLVRNQDFEIEYLEKNLKIVSEDSILKKEIWDYLKQATFVESH